MLQQLTLLSWFNNLVDNIVHGLQHNIVHSWQHDIVQRLLTTCNRLCVFTRVGKVPCNLSSNVDRKGLGQRRELADKLQTGVQHWKKLLQSLQKVELDLLSETDRQRWKPICGTNQRLLCYTCQFAVHPLQCVIPKCYSQIILFA